MARHLLRFACLIVTTLPVLAAAADTPAAAATASASSSQTAPTPAKPAARVPEPCVPTGSRIARRDGNCNANAGRSYDEEQIRQTGANNVGQALQLLDPGVTVNRR